MQIAMRPSHSIIVSCTFHLCTHEIIENRCKSMWRERVCSHKSTFISFNCKIIIIIDIIIVIIALHIPMIFMTLTIICTISVLSTTSLSLSLSPLSIGLCLYIVCLLWLTYVGHVRSLSLLFRITRVKVYLENFALNPRIT